MRKYQCNACGIRICTAEYQDGGGVPFKCTYATDGYCKPQWKEIEREVATLPRLTEEVFNRPDCPAWANYAAVDGCGRGFYYEAIPRLHKHDRFFLLSTIRCLRKGKRRRCERPEDKDCLDGIEAWLDAPADCVAENGESAKQADLCCKSANESEVQ